MNWCARHPFLLWLVLLVADIFLARHFHLSSVSSKDPEMAGWFQMCVMAMLFGTLCIRFPHILGTMEGPWDNAWLNPTPQGVVRGMGWLMMAAPLLVFLFLAMFGTSK